MSDKIDTQISQAGYTSPVTLGRVDATLMTQMAATKSVKIQSSGSSKDEPTPKDAVGIKSNRKGTYPLGEVTLRFKIDSQTNDVTILILDKASQKVVRTIPPEEMARMDPGELLQLFA